MIKETISPSDTELKLLKLRRVQLEAELLNLNLRINNLTLKSDELLKELKL